MNKYYITYAYTPKGHTSKNSRTVTVTAETERDAKENISLSHSSKGETVVEWRKVEKK